MTTTRWITAAAAFAAVVAVAGCGDKKSCNDATPPVGELHTSSCTAIKAGAPVTVSFHVCPQCDQGTPTCLVHDNGAQGQITLEPVAEVCDPKSCDIITPQSCIIPTLDCQFTAPAITGNVNVTIVTPAGEQSFQVPVSGSGSTSCSL